MHEGPRDRGPLQLSPRDPRRMVLQTMGEPHPAGPFPGAGQTVLPGHAGQEQRQRDVLRQGEGGEEVEELEDEADPVAPQRRQPLVVQLREVDAVDGHRPRRGPVHAPAEVQERGLAAPGRSHDGHELAGRELQTDAPQGVHRGLAVAVALVQAPGLQHRPGPRAVA